MIHTRTQQEYDDVVKVLGKGYQGNDWWKEFKEETCLNPVSTYAGRAWYLDNDYKVISAEQFLAANGVQQKEWKPQVGEWITCKSGYSDRYGDPYGGAGYKEGKVFKLLRTSAHADGDKMVLWPEDMDGGIYIRAAKPATPEEIQKAGGKVKKKLSFTTGNGLDVHEGDLMYWIYGPGWKVDGFTCNTWETHANQIGKEAQVFYTEEAARQWVEEHKKSKQQSTSQVLSQTPWIPNTPVTAENCYIGMRVKCSQKFGDRYPTSTGKSKEGVVVAIEPDGRLKVTFEKATLTAIWEDIYVAPGETTKTNQVTNQSVNQNKKQTSYEHKEQQHLSKGKQYTGTAILLTDHQAVKRGQTRTGTPLCDRRQPGYTERGYQGNRKAVSSL